MRRIIVIVPLVCFVAGISPAAWAEEENPFMTVFKDGVYGGLAGALVGSAVLAFAEEPRDHLDYIAKGAAVGVILGVAFGLVQTTRSVAELEDGRITVGLPTPQIYSDPSASEAHPLGVKVGFFAWRF
jgi:hypothetical protein